MSMRTEISAPAGRESTAGIPAGGTPAARPKPSRRRDRVAYLFLAPWFAGLLLITVGPLLASLYLSFTDYNLLQPPALDRPRATTRRCSPTTRATCTR